jgi:hypothetical protein
MAMDPMAFGRRNPHQAEPPPRAGWSVDDLRLFASTFVAGFVFVSVFLG